jgi:hypothetical protein
LEVGARRAEAGNLQEVTKVVAVVMSLGRLAAAAERGGGDCDSAWQPRRGAEPEGEEGRGMKQAPRAEGGGGRGGDSL